MIGIGEARGCRTVALLTAMDRPLGFACGNALETEEAIHGLMGQGPPDLMAVTYALGEQAERRKGGKNQPGDQPSPPIRRSTHPPPRLSSFHPEWSSPA